MAGYLGSRPVIVQVDGYQREESESRYVNVSGDDFSGHLDFVDDAKARFGSSDELHIYTESSGSGHSYIQGDNIVIRSAAGTARLTVTSNDVDVSSGALKIGGTTVINSSRAITATGLTVDGVATLNRTNPILLLNETDTTNLNVGLNVSASTFNIGKYADAGNKVNDLLSIDVSTGDISFYDGSGNAKLLWDASAERLGIRTNSPSNALTINQNGATDYIRLEGPSSGDIAGGLQLYRGSTLRAAFYANPTHDLTILSEVGINFRANNANRMLITSAGNVGIGTNLPVTSYKNALQVHGADGGGNIRITNDTTGTGTGNGFEAVVVGVDAYLIQREAAPLIFYTNDTERMRITSSGSVGISTDNPDAKLHVAGNTKLGSASSASWTNSLNDAGGLDVFVGSGSKALTVWDDNRQGAPRFQVDRDGQVGIGRAPTSTFKLDVHEELSGNWLAHFENTHNSNGYGVKIRAGDDVNVTSFRVSNYDNSKTLLNVYGDGTVTKPNTPAFWVRRNGNQTGYDGATVSQWGNNYVEWNYAEFNIGNHMTISGSNVGKFIAPVAGLYHFETAVYSNTSATIWSQGWFNVNGARKAGTDFILSANDEFIQYSSNIYLQANDQVAVHPFTNTGNTNTTIIANVYHTWFKGHLIA